MKKMLLALLLSTSFLVAATKPSDAKIYFVAPAGDEHFFVVFRRSTVHFEPFRYSSDGQVVYAHITAIDGESLSYLSRIFKSVTEVEWDSVKSWNQPRKPFF